MATAETRDYVGPRKDYWPYKKWDEKYYILVYEYAKAGFSGKDISKALGIDEDLLTEWYRTKPALEWARDRGRGLKGGTDPLKEYYYNCLSKKLKKVWEKISKIDHQARKEKVYGRLGVSEDDRKEIFIYALSACNFSVTRACRSAGITGQTLDEWSKDPNFRGLVAAMVQAKKDFYEEALVKKVAEGDMVAIVFANKTLNKDRGYGHQVDVNVQGRVEHAHAVLDITKLDLPLGVQRQVLDAIRKFKATGESVVLEHKPIPKGVNGAPSPILAGEQRRHYAANGGMKKVELQRLAKRREEAVDGSD